MKYQQGKIKREHHILSEFEGTLQQLATLEHIQRIIPGRITRKQQASSGTHLSISYATSAGFKMHIKKGGTAQEIFVTCKKEHTRGLIDHIQQHITQK